MVAMSPLLALPRDPVTLIRIGEALAQSFHLNGQWISTPTRHCLKVPPAIWLIEEPSWISCLERVIGITGPEINKV